MTDMRTQFLVDASYQEAAKRIENGQLGPAYLIKSCTNDLYDTTGYFLNYAKKSGGIFMDCGIHDIDIGRYLLNVGNTDKLKNPAKQVTKVFATGLNTVYPELAELGDCDNALGVIEFENGSKMDIHLSRTSIHGHDVVCEVFGTKGKFVINAVSYLSHYRKQGGGINPSSSRFPTSPASRSATNTVSERSLSKSI